MIILFGSYARGKYVEDRYISQGITYEYISDYDFLVVTKNNPEKSYCTGKHHSLQSSTL